MKRVHINDSCDVHEELIEEVAEVIGKDDFDVELIGVNASAYALPSNYMIKDYSDGKMLAVCSRCEITRYKSNEPLD